MLLLVYFIAAMTFVLGLVHFALGLVYDSAIFGLVASILMGTAMGLFTVGHVLLGQGRRIRDLERKIDRLSTRSEETSSSVPPGAEGS